MAEEYGRRGHPERRERQQDQTQPIPRVADNTETRSFVRPGSTKIIKIPLDINPEGLIPAEFVKGAREKADPPPVDVSWVTTEERQPWKPGIIMRVFGYTVSVLFALFCVGIIAITFGYILWKYYHHLLD